MNILFRVDSSNDIGIGHVMRCLTLAKVLHQREHDCYFICREHPGHINAMIKNYGFEILPLPPLILNIEATKKPIKHASWLGAPQLQDANECKHLLCKSDSIKIDWIIIDHYAISQVWESEMRSLSQRIMVIDDLADRVHDCDLLLDMNINLPHKPNYENLLPKETQCLLGPRYCLLREQFSRSDNNAIVSSNKKSILLYFGGTDPCKLTKLVLGTLAKTNLANIYDINVLLSSSNQDFELITEFCNEKNYRCYIDEPDVAKLMQSCALAIVACGFICYELAAAKVPAIYLAASEIQEDVAKSLTELGVGQYIKLNDFNPDNLTKTIEVVAQLTTEKFDSLVSNGTNYVADILESNYEH